MATAAKRKRAKRIAGIGIAAAALGVTRQHLGLVLHGDRTSPTLLARYHAWKKQQRAGLLEIARAATYLANRS